MALNKGDLKQIRTIVKEEVDDRLESGLKTQKNEIIEEMDDRLTKLRSDFFEKVDPILKEVVTAREERPLIENRLAKLEKIHPKGKHVLAS